VTFVLWLFEAGEMNLTEAAKSAPNHREKHESSVHLSTSTLLQMLPLCTCYSVPEDGIELCLLPSAGWANPPLSASSCASWASVPWPSCWPCVVDQILNPIRDATVGWVGDLDRFKDHHQRYQRKVVLL